MLLFYPKIAQNTITHKVYCKIKVQFKRYVPAICFNMLQFDIRSCFASGLLRIFVIIHK